MPYIKKEDRLKFDHKAIQDTIEKIDTEGELNYVISIMMKGVMNRWSKSYKTLNSIIGAVECAKLEFSRRVVAPYEDKKIEENSDIY